ncbi:MAG: Ig-like domain-containing protein [Anaerolineae bacterium]|nr:Ig-like domain-containing protein [Anaerolineae bacterium]
MNKRTVSLLVAGSTGLLLALASLALLGGPSLARDSVEATIVVDGVVDAAYGPPAASDSNLDGNGNDVMDLGELYVAEDGGSYYFAFTIDADVGAADWGKYVIYVDTTNDGSGAPDDAWGRNVAVNAPHQPEYGIYTWVDTPPYGTDHTQFWEWSGSWSQNGTADEAALVAGATSVIEWRIAKSRLGSPPAIWVEAWSTGEMGNPNAQDTINDPPEDWNAWDWETTAELDCSTQYPGVQLGVTYPPDGHYFALPYLDVAGVVSPTTGVTVTVNVNGSAWFNPAVGLSGAFTQPITLLQGSNTITVTAEDGGDATTVVRHVSFGAAHDDDVYWDGLYHDSRDPAYRSPTGAVPTGMPVTIRFRSYTGDLTGARLRVWDDRADEQALYPMSIVTSDPAYDYWEVALPAEDLPTILWYRFIATDGADTDYYEDNHVVDDVYRGYNEGGPGAAYEDTPDLSYQITVYDPTYETPDWIQNGVICQVLPDRFRDGDPANNVVSGTHFIYGNPAGGIEYPAWNSQVIDPRDPGDPYYNRWSEDFYGGDLPGIVEQLDYLESVGITALYLNPIFSSPSNHKYDTIDFGQVDPHLGGGAALALLLAEAEARGMNVILDGVFNHTSSDSVYFDRYSRWDADGNPTTIGDNDGSGACESPDSPYRGWYTFVDVAPGSGPCTADDGTPNGADYESWWGYDSLPILRSDNPEVRAYIYGDGGADSIATRWIISGTAGWRLDVGGDIDPGVAHDPANDYWEGFRQAVKGADPDAVIIGEEWGDATSWLLGGEWDAVMNYRFRSALLSFMRERHYEDNDNNAGSSGGVLDPISPSQLDAWLHSIEEDYAPEAWRAMMNLMGSHDTNRLRFVLSKNQKGEDTEHIPYNPATDLSPAEVDVYQQLLAILQFSLPGAPTVYYGDEVGIDAPGSWHNQKWEDDPYNRVPFPWDDTPGYYSQRPAITAHYALLARTRAAHPALRAGSFDTLVTDDAALVYAYGRKWVGETAGDAALVVVNRGLTATRTVVLDVGGYLGSGTVLTDVLDGGQSYAVSPGGRITVTGLAPMWGALLVYASGDLQPPDAPANLVASEGEGQVGLQWDPVADAASYNLYRSFVSGGGYGLVAGGLPGTAYTDTGVVNGTWYYYVVTAVDGDGYESGDSNEAAALPHYEIDWANLQHPPEISHTIGITPTEPVYGQVWIDGVTGQPGQTEGLVAQIGCGIAAEPPISWTGWVDADFNGDVGNNDEFSASLLPEQVGEFYYLYRYSTTGGRDWVYADLSGLISSTAVVSPGLLHVFPSGDTTPPPTPANLRVTGWGIGHIALAWDPVGVPDLYAYDLFRWGEGETFSDALPIDRIAAPTAVYTDEMVTSGQTYTYTVQALDSSFNASGFSNFASGRAEERLVTVTFNVAVPVFTPPGDTIYIAGDPDVFGADWDPDATPMARLDATHWTITILAPEGSQPQYKYTRGSWQRVEKWGWLSGYANRTVTVTYGADGTMAVDDVARNWRDPLVVSVYPPPGGTSFDPSGVITATFNRGLDPATVDETTVLVNGGAVLGAVSYVSPTVTFAPDAPLDPNGQYAVRLTTGIRDGEDEVPLQAEYAWTFGRRRVYLPVMTRE